MTPRKKEVKSQTKTKLKPKARPALLVMVSSEERAILEAIAVALGYLYGTKPNISAMLRDIAAGQLLLSRKKGRV